MKRTTIMLPDELAQLVDRERRRRDISAAAVIREAVEAYLMPPAAPKTYSFIGIARSGGGEPTAANMEEWLERVWADEIERDSGLKPRQPNAASADAPIAGSEASSSSGIDAGDS
jgi:hypothetical protein